MSNLWNLSHVQAKRDVLIAGETIPAMFWNAAAQRGPQVWMRQKQLGIWRSWSWEQTAQAVREIGHGLLHLGFAPGDTASILSNTLVEWVLADLAVLCAGGVSNGIYPTDAASQVLYLCEDSSTSVLFVEDDEQLDKALEVRAGLPRLKTIVVFDMKGLRALDDPGIISLAQLRELGRAHLAGHADALAQRSAQCQPQDLAILVYTSGTTGKPKGAVRRFGVGQVLGFAAFMERVALKRSDRHLCVCPLYHSTGLGFAAMSLMVGGAVVIEPEFEPMRFLRAIERERVTTTALVPTMLHRLMALDPAVIRGHATRSLRVMMCGGAQLPAPLAARTLGAFGDVLYNFYGATETGLVTVATPDDLRALPGTIGRALHGVSVRLLDDAGAAVATGEVGELYARSSMLVEGYHGDEAATRSSLRDGHFSVGDLATVDADGRYMIVGRRRDMVITGGVNVYPAEVEAILDAHPAVAQSAVIGVADDEWGERLRAFVVLREPDAVEARARAQELKQWCRARASGAKVPREWAFVGGLPSNPTGKVLKRELADWTGDVVAV
ncbi:MAG: O-succinylbenzoic acid--CoA ligase [Myxococcaceae bacterium]|nr:O-succinylbenzoic acid--CoA ligase [Myxococcaceae bacterium]